MNNVQIFELEIENYRQYRENQSISLGTTSDRHINVIEGQNGSGKSNILNAVTLCFYGEETHNSDEEDGLESDPLINKKCLQDLSPGESTEGYVEVKLGKDEPEYAFRRKFTTVYEGDDTDSDRDEPEYNSTIGDLRLRQRFGASDWEPNPEPENILREILPTHVHEYFLFDGEQLDEFFQPGYKDHVRAAVLDVSHIELLNSGVKHLEKVRRGFEAESSDLGGDIEKLQESKEKASNELERLKQKKSRQEDELGNAREKIDKIHDQLAGSADDDVREMQDRRAYLTERLDELEGELVDANEDVATSIAKAGGVAYNVDNLQYAISELESYGESEETVPGLTEELLNELLSRGQCICGTDLSECESTEDHLEELLDEITEEDQDVIEGRYRMDRAIKKGESLIEQMISDLEELEETRTSIDEGESELAGIAARLEDEDTIDNERAQELEQRRQEVQKRIGEIEREIGEIGGQIQSQEQVVGEKREEWKRAMNEQEEHELLVQKSEFIGRASDKIGEIKHEILESVRAETEDRLERYYNDLIWKNEDYEVLLTDEYEIRLYGPNGRKNLGSLSAGERQVLALSFMASLSKISGFAAPVIIDTPLGRISSDPKQRIAQNVPDYLSDSQVTFLMTDVEYSEDVRAYISNEVSNEYHLDFHDGVTEVIPR